jgi:tetratricopeptide (TPR) repeat protein
MAHAVVGNQKSALAAAQEALKIRKRLHQSLDVARALSGLAAAQSDQDGPRSALGHFQAALAAFRPLEEVAERCHAGLALAVLQISLGKNREARDVADEAIAWCVDDTLTWCKWTLLEVKADTFEVECGFREALTCREQAFLLRQRENAVSATALRCIADLYRHLGRHWEAEQMYGMARSCTLEEIGARGPIKVPEESKERQDRSTPSRERLTLPGLRLPGWERSH